VRPPKVGDPAPLRRASTTWTFVPSRAPSPASSRSVSRRTRSADVLAAIDLAREFKFKLVIEGGNEAWRHAAELASVGASVVLRAVATPPVVGNDLAPITFEAGEGRRSAGPRS
jgi:hypothetical protein